MPINMYSQQRGFTLIELVAFIVVIGISVTAIGIVFQHSVVRIQDPLIHSQLVSMAQSQLDETLSRRYDENTPTGGVPACGSLTPCAGIGLDAGEVLTTVSTLDDVDDFNGYQDIPQTGYQRTISVVNAGADFGVTAAHAKRITVTVTAPQGQSVSVAVYRFNF
jgi:MSHA pilin protein MshD